MNACLLSHVGRNPLYIYYIYVYAVINAYSIQEETSCFFMPYICTLIIILNALVHASLISFTDHMHDIFIVSMLFWYLYHSLYCELFIMEEIKNIYLKANNADPDQIP